MEIDTAFAGSIFIRSYFYMVFSNNPEGLFKKKGDFS